MAMENGIAPRSGLRGQMATMLSLFQSLTNLHFLLVEQRASTSASSTRSTLTSQMEELAQTIRTGLVQLSRPHQEKLRRLSIIISLEHQRRASTLPSSSTPRVPSSGEVSEALEVVDYILAELLTRARRHAHNQQRIGELVATARQSDVDLRGTIKRLNELRNRCDRLVRLGKEELESMDRAEKHPIPYEEILHYARKLSQTTSAPPGFKLQIDEEEIADDGAAISTNRPAAAQAGKELYQGETNETQQSRSSRVPAHLQDKLPFPSENALRRSVMGLPLLSWEAYKRSLQPGGGEEEEEQQHASAPGAQIRQAQSTISNRQRPAAEEEEEDAFGLDLS